MGGQRTGHPTARRRAWRSSSPGCGGSISAPPASEPGRPAGRSNVPPITPGSPVSGSGGRNAARATFVFGDLFDPRPNGRSPRTTRLLVVLQQRVGLVPVDLLTTADDLFGVVATTRDPSSRAHHRGRPPATSRPPPRRRARGRSRAMDGCQGNPPCATVRGKPVEDEPVLGVRLSQTLGHPWPTVNLVPDTSLAGVP